MHRLNVILFVSLSADCCHREVVPKGTITNRVRRTVPVLHKDDDGRHWTVDDQGPRVHPAAHGLAGRLHPAARQELDQRVRKGSP